MWRSPHSLHPTPGHFHGQFYFRGCSVSGRSIPRGRRPRTKPPPFKLFRFAAYTFSFFCCTVIHRLSCCCGSWPTTPLPQFLACNMPSKWCERSIGASIGTDHSDLARYPTEHAFLLCCHTADEPATNEGQTAVVKEIPVVATADIDATETSPAVVEQQEESSDSPASVGDAAPSAGSQDAAESTDTVVGVEDGAASLGEFRHKRGVFG